MYYTTYTYYMFLATIVMVEEFLFNLLLRKILIDVPLQPEDAIRHSASVSSIKKTVK